MYTGGCAHCACQRYMSQNHCSRFTLCGRSVISNNGSVACVPVIILEIQNAPWCSNGGIYRFCSICMLRLGVLHARRQADRQRQLQIPEPIRCAWAIAYWAVIGCRQSSHENWFRREQPSYWACVGISTVGKYQFFSWFQCLVENIFLVWILENQTHLISQQPLE